MKRKAPTIDISASVMQRIERDGISIRSVAATRAIRITKWIGLLIAAALALIGILSLGYVLRHDVFTDYSSLLNTKAFVVSLPWPGIVVTILSIGVFAVLLHKIRSDSANLNMRYVLGAALVLVACMGILSNVVSPDKTPSVIARAAYWSDKDPVELYGKVVEIIDDDTLIVEVNGKKLTVYTKTKGINKGDWILILGKKSSENVYAKGIKVVEQAPKEVNSETVKKEGPKAPEQPKPVEEAKPVVTEKPKTTTPAPAPAPKPEPAPAPEPVIDTITITKIEGPFGSGPSYKYKISWEANFSSELGYKLVWSTSPNPEYPGSNNYYWSTPNTSAGYGYVVNDLGTGQYYVRVCKKIASGCSTYSGQKTVNF